MTVDRRIAPFRPVSWASRRTDGVPLPPALGGTFNVTLAGRRRSSEE